jgi:hypothetical protein
MGQAEAITATATSGRVVDLLVGLAGADSVTGLAASATSAAVLTEDLGIATENRDRRRC